MSLVFKEVAVTGDRTTITISDIPIFGKPVSSHEPDSLELERGMNVYLI